jgi:hypothetical protein
METFTKEELNQQIAIIENDCRARIANAKLSYAKANQKHQIGDVIQSNNDYKIVIEKIKYSTMSYPPEAVYYGPWLKKDGQPNKKHEINYIYQSNIK